MSTAEGPQESVGKSATVEKPVTCSKDTTSGTQELTARKFTAVGCTAGETLNSSDSKQQ
jgi:hypothetical protein